MWCSCCTDGRQHFFNRVVSVDLDADSLNVMLLPTGSKNTECVLWMSDWLLVESEDWRRGVCLLNGMKLIWMRYNLPLDFLGQWSGNDSSISLSLLIQCFRFLFCGSCGGIEWLGYEWVAFLSHITWDSEFRIFLLIYLELWAAGLGGREIFRVEYKISLLIQWVEWKTTPIRLFSFVKVLWSFTFSMRVEMVSILILAFVFCVAWGKDWFYRIC